VGKGGDRNLVTGLTSQAFVHSSCPKPQLQLTISHPWIVLELFRLSAPTLATDATKSWFLYRPSNSYQRNFAKTSPIVDFQLLLALHILHFSNEDNVDAKRDQDKQVKPVLSPHPHNITRLPVLQEVNFGRWQREFRSYFGYKGLSVISTAQLALLGMATGETPCKRTVG